MTDEARITGDKELEDSATYSGSDSDSDSEAEQEEYKRAYAEAYTVAYQEAQHEAYAELVESSINTFEFPLRAREEDSHVSEEGETVVAAQSDAKAASAGSASVQRMKSRLSALLYCLGALPEQEATEAKITASKSLSRVGSYMSGHAELVEGEMRYIRAMSTDDEMQVLVQASFDHIKPRLKQVVESFYQYLFSSHPELQPLFRAHSAGALHQKMSSVLALLVSSLKNKAAMDSIMQDLGSRHISYGAVDEYFEYMRSALIQALKDELVPAGIWDDNTENAWTAVFRRMAKSMQSGMRKKVVRVSPSERVMAARSKRRSLNIFRSAWRSFRGLFDSLCNCDEVFAAAIGGALLLVLVHLPDADHIIHRALHHLDSVGMIVALVLFLKELPSRRKQLTYQLWQAVDNSRGVLNSHVRIQALQDLNDMQEPLRTLNLNGCVLKEVNLSRADMKEAQLKDADLSCSELNGVDLRSNLSGSTLVGANLAFSNLAGSNFSQAILEGCKLHCANLENANLSGANLSGADLSGAKLTNAYLAGANLSGAEVTLDGVVGLTLNGAILPNGTKQK
ncbi:unnamed protein product [Chrysoparadoxa australica]